MLRRFFIGSTNTSSDDASFNTMLDDVNASALTSISINNPHLSAEQISKLATTLKSEGAKKLTSLNIANEIEEKSIVELAEGIAAATSLTTVNIAGKSIALKQSPAQLAAAISGIFMKETAKPQAPAPSQPVKLSYAQAAASNPVGHIVLQPWQIKAAQDAREAAEKHQGFNKFIQLVEDREDDNEDNEYDFVSDASSSLPSVSGMYSGHRSPSPKLQSVPTVSTPDDTNDVSSIRRPGMVAAQ